MEDIEVDGLVVREVKTGEADKIITLLTAEHGKITITGKGVGSIRNKYAASAQLFSYSTFQLRKKGNFYYIKDTFFIECFMNIRYDVEKLALANYVCDVASDLALEDTSDPELLSLILNTLYAIANLDSKPLSLIKAAFEFKAASHAGFMPDLSICGLCGAELTEDSFVDVMNGRVVCRKCRAQLTSDPEYAVLDPSAKIYIKISPSVLAAMRYIAYAPVKRYLSFTLEADELEGFGVVCERYLLNHLEHGFSSLDYYKKLINDIPG